MASLPTKKTIQNLCSKGFEQGRSGKHVPFNYRTLSGKKSSITTHIRHTPSHKDLGDRLISSMASDCGLTRGEFIRFAECTMGQSEYERIVKENGRLKE